MNPVLFLHGALGWALLALAVVLLLAAGWSYVIGRRGGLRTHRFLVDRLALAAVGLAALGAALGLVLVVFGSRPSDVLHLVYGTAAVLVLPVAVVLGTPARERAAAGGATRSPARDAWLAAGAAALAGIAIRLIGTG